MASLLRFLNEAVNCGMINEAGFSFPVIWDDPNDEDMSDVHVLQFWMNQAKDEPGMPWYLMFNGSESMFEIYPKEMRQLMRDILNILGRKLRLSVDQVEDMGKLKPSMFTHPNSFYRIKLKEPLAKAQVRSLIQPALAAQTAFVGARIANKEVDDIEIFED